jgi:D-alanine-D-alanine ligase
MLEVLIRRIPKELLQTPVAVIMGGDSPEREFSLRSGLRVAKALSTLGLKVVPLEYNALLQSELEAQQCQICFLATHGVPGEDGKLQGYLESVGRYYSSASVAGCALSMNKLASKALLASCGIKTPTWMMIDPDISHEESVREMAQKLGFPLILKPVFGGSSIGVRLVNDILECHTALENLAKDHYHLFAEQYIKGRELTVSILEDSKARPFALPVMELEPKSLFYDYECKLNSGKKDFIVPAELSEAQNQKIVQTSLDIHRILMLRDISRSDFILDQQGELYVLETNAIPGLTENSDLPAQAKAYGMSFEEVALSILMGPWRRYSREFSKN